MALAGLLNPAQEYTMFKERMQDQMAAVVNNTSGLLKGAERLQSLLGDKMRYEEDYAKQLAKLSRNYQFDEFLSHCTAFDALSRFRELFVAYGAHITAHNQALNERVATPLRGQLQELRTNTKILTEHARRLERERETMRETLRKARAKYWRSASETEDYNLQMERQFNQAESPTGKEAGPKDKLLMQRLSLKASQATRDCKANAVAYQEAAQRMQAFNEKYHMQADALLAGFERNDRLVLEVSRASLNSTLTVMEELLQALQSDLAFARESVAALESDTDISHFIDHHVMQQLQASKGAAVIEECYEEYPWKQPSMNPNAPSAPLRPAPPPHVPSEPLEVIPPEIFDRVLEYVQELHFTTSSAPSPTSRPQADPEPSSPTSPSWVMLDGHAKPETTEHETETNGNPEQPPTDAPSITTETPPEADPGACTEEPAAASVPPTEPAGAQEERLSRITTLMKDHDARMALGRILTKQRVTCVSLHKESFDELGTVIRLALSECQDADGEPTDVKAGSILLNMCQTFCYVREDGSKVYLQQVVKDHALFTNLRFWQESFFDALMVEKRKQQQHEGKWKELDTDEQEEERNREQNITFGQLSTFVFNMLSMGLPITLVDTFVEKSCMINELCEEYRMMLQATVEKTVADMVAQQ
eukprot:TRINITY_DN15881_c0_g1_i1.p1 TRINITY_DN15881_c0_g1~~TRINITY_DN15881_c0_g1_i1.p1  ORF type:complete len:670 (+),score=161.00 TRINITY_DN15881_c0_g1_i1:63-2012(+)